MREKADKSVALATPMRCDGRMRVLVLGGSVFLSRAVALEAAARGHDVTAACRGSSGSVPEGVRHVPVDRLAGLPDELTSTAYDAVVDVARSPSWVRAAVAAWPGAHWTFVSTINVYADDATPDGRPGTLPLREPRHDDADLAVDPEAYGPMKVACEQAVLDGAGAALVVRPGLIVGPGDPTGRFTYWPARLDGAGDGEPVLAGGSPDDPVPEVDVRAQMLSCVALYAWTLPRSERCGLPSSSTYETTRGVSLASASLTRCAAKSGSASVSTNGWPMTFCCSTLAI